MSHAQDQTALAGALAGLDELAIAVSGGVDSMTLAHAARELLGRAMVAFHAVSPAVPPEATQRVRDHARRFDWPLEIIDAGEFDDPDYLANPVDRCFFCKRDLYGTIRRHWQGTLASGTNLDDLGDFRPGLAAAARHDVRHPFVEARIGKTGVRAIAAARNLDDLAELPAAPCLSSRIETGIPVTPGRLALVLEVERLVARMLGSGTIRCRIRREGLEIQLEPRLLDALGDPTGSLMAATIEEVQQRLGRVGPVSFTDYRMGSAFVRDPAP
jgi:pyridinium-3,5-biscarboxylic acid mononucleotide sulfurtransferase